MSNEICPQWYTLMIKVQHFQVWSKWPKTSNQVKELESVEGVANKFGLGGSYKNTNKQKEANIKNILEEILVTDDDSNEIQKEFGLPPQVSSADILAEEIGIQKNMQEVTKEQQQTSKKNLSFHRPALRCEERGVTRSKAAKFGNGKVMAY
ncbi:hypothetical protein FF38_03486 [Lucilia cuprina]|uniref:Uncharacterized protein n=1 Tax=Lucilia cuprina TaxID=7375 RepID=A0A0L0BQW4_LUCCU|nr:hypothetical protein FF38_03486 [Lucilia cuprina]